MSLISKTSELVGIAEKVAEVLRKYRNKELVFFKDISDLEEVKEYKKTSEFLLFKDFVNDKKLRFLFQAGLNLRRHEKDEKKLEQIRDRIYRGNKKDGQKDLHIAQFIQNGLFTIYLGVISKKGLTNEECKEEIKYFFDNIDRECSFIQMNDNIDVIATTISSRIQINNPHIYVINGSKTAIKKCRQIKNKVMSKISGYEFTTHGNNDVTETYFITKKLAF
jgi:hypothetical protein